MQVQLTPTVPTPHRCVLKPLAAALAWALAQGAAAQATDAPRMEAVVVSANKRIEKLENVPMAISVLSDAALERNNVREMADVVALSPALTVTYGSTPANNSINMRGIGTSSIGIGVEADVAVIIDDIPIGMQVKAFSDMADLARVEVLKGPQSSLFGKSAVAGAINMVSKPVSGPLAGKASVLYTNDGEWRIGGSYGGEVNDQFAFRVALSNTNFPGNMHNLSTGRDVNGSGGRTAMAHLVWHPTSELDIDFTPRYNSSHTGCCVAALRSMSPMAGALLLNLPQLPPSKVLDGITVGPNNVTVRNDVPTGQDSTDRGAGLKLNYALPSGHTLTAITSVDTYRADDIRDQDFTDLHALLWLPLANGKPAAVDQGNIQYGTFDVRARTGELRLLSPESGKLRYVAGLWYGKNNIAREFTRGYPGVAATSPTKYVTTTYNTNRAVFGQASWDFAPDYTLTAGLRWNREVSGYHFVVGAPPPAAFVASGNFGSDGNGENAVTGKLSLQHQLSKEVMVYGTYATGYKGKAYDLTSSLNAATAASLPVASETSTMVELGSKINFLDNRATLSAALFSSRFDDYQQNSGSFLPGTTVFVTRLNSIPYVQTRGLELDLAYMPMAGMTVNGGLALTRATIGSFRNGPCYAVPGSPNGGQNAACDRNSAFGGPVQDLSGARMPNAPRVKASFGLQYDHRLGASAYDGFVNLSVRGQGSMNSALSQDPSGMLPGYGITNLAFGAKDRGGKYKLTFFVNNLFDHQYALSSLNGGGAWSSKAPNPVVNVATASWTPARDAFRYVGVRFDAKF